MQKPKLTKRKPLIVLTKAILLASLLISTTSCRTSSGVRIVPSDQATVIVKKGETLIVPHDGVFLSSGQYVRMKNALIDRKNKP